jgi:enamine deaminase RidA (YjgF/YER057c/UK114 family)
MIRRSYFLCGSLLAAAFAEIVGGQGRRIVASGAPPASSFGPSGCEADGYVYVAGQNARRSDGSLPEKFSDQVRQSLDKVKLVVQAAGLTLDHVVYVQVYLQDVSHYSELNEVFASYFPKFPPARAVLGVAGSPESPLQINAVAVRDLTGKQSISPSDLPSSKAFSAGVLTHDRFFISTMPGLDPNTGQVPAKPGDQVDMALDRLNSVLKAAGLSAANMVFVNPYLTTDIPMRIMNEHYAPRFEFGNTPARATIEVSGLPEGAHIAYTGVAVRDLSRRRAIRPKNMPPSPTASPCVFAGDTLYCSAKSGFIPGPNGGIYMAETANQTRQTMRNLLDNLEEADMSFAQAVSTTIYLDDLAESAAFHNIYKKYFKGSTPAETTLQQLPPGDRKADAEGQYPTLEQMSLIAVRSYSATP